METIKRYAMKNNVIIILTLLVAGLAGCREEKVQVYDGDNYIQFVKHATVDSTIIPFLFSPGKMEVDSPLIVKIVGRGHAAETPYSINIDTELTTAVEGTHFILPGRTAFKAGALRDTLAIKFLRTTDMKMNSFRLVLRLEATDDFVLGEPRCHYYTFVVHDQVSRPVWWEEWGIVESYYLGEYSDRKFEYFIEATGVADLSEATDNEIWLYSLRFKYWLQEQENDGNLILDDWGDPMIWGVYVNG
jgi:hypothetical protein